MRETEMENKRLKIRAYGIVQGIGFRPFVSRLAAELHLAGDVANKGSYVEIHVEGKCSDVDQFREDLVARAPAVAAIVRVEDSEEELTGSTMFSRGPGRKSSGGRRYCQGRGL